MNLKKFSNPSGKFVKNPLKQTTFVPNELPVELPIDLE